VLCCGYGCAGPCCVRSGVGSARDQGWRACPCRPLPPGMAEDIPVVDLSLPLEDVASKLSEALESVGFAYVSSHGVPEAILAEAFAVSRDFFAQPVAAKTRAASTNRALRGYSSVSSENFASLAGQVGPNDLVEKLRFGPPPPPLPLPVPASPPMAASVADGSAAPSTRRRSTYFPNTWPEQPERSRPVLEALYAHMTCLTERLCRVFALVLGLRENFFVDRMGMPTSILSCNHYPPVTHAAGSAWSRERIAAHTDVSLFTVVAQSMGDGREAFLGGGLEVRAKGRWVPVPPRLGTLVLNVGDCLSDWTRGRWKSTIHRVSLPKQSSLPSPPAAVVAGEGTNGVKRLVGVHSQRCENELGLAIDCFQNHLATVGLLDDRQQAGKQFMCGSRYSFVFFVTPDADCDVVTLPAGGHETLARVSSTHGGQTDPPPGAQKHRAQVHAPVTFAEWRRARVRRAMRCLKQATNNAAAAAASGKQQQGVVEPGG